MEIAEAKRRLRAQLRNQLRGLSDCERASIAGQICRFLLEWELVQKAQRIFAFWPMRFEVQLQPVWISLSKDKEIYFPALGAEGVPCFRKWDGIPEHLVQIQRGFCAPPEEAISDMPRVRELVFVPGLGFSRAGGRLGRGGGFYDRILARVKADGAIAVGVCFFCQILDSIPMEPHDVSVDGVVFADGTEVELVWARTMDGCSHMSR